MSSTAKNDAVCTTRADGRPSIRWNKFRHCTECGHPLLLTAKRPWRNIIRRVMAAGVVEVFCTHVTRLDTTVLSLDARTTWQEVRERLQAGMLLFNGEPLGDLARIGDSPYREAATAVTAVTGGAPGAGAGAAGAAMQMQVQVLPIRLGGPKLAHFDIRASFPHDVRCCAHEYGVTYASLAARQHPIAPDTLASCGLGFTVACGHTGNPYALDHERLGHGLPVWLAAWSDALGSWDVPQPVACAARWDGLSLLRLYNQEPNGWRTLCCRGGCAYLLTLGGPPGVLYNQAVRRCLEHVCAGPAQLASALLPELLRLVAEYAAWDTRCELRLRNGGVLECPLGLPFSVCFYVS